MNPSFRVLLAAACAAALTACSNPAAPRPAPMPSAAQTRP